MFLTEIQRSVTRYLQSHSFFQTEPAIPVVCQNDKDLLGKMAAQMGRLGIVVLVAPVGGDYGQTETNCAYFEKAKFTCRVRENIPVNRSEGGSLQPADYVAEVCAMLLKHYQPKSLDGECLSGGGIQVTAVNVGDDDKGIFAWDCLFQISGGLSHAAVRRTFTDPNAA